MRIAITGAAGKTGRAVADAVLARGHEVVPIVRRPQGLDGERLADLSEVGAMSDALADADALYLIAPNVHPDELGLLRPVLDLCEQADLRVVYHSVMHPYAPAMPHHVGKAEVENALRTSPLRWSILQPASYMENTLAPVRDAKDGRWVQPYDTTTLFTPVALEDLAAAAAIVLTEPGHACASYELAGPSALSTDDMAAKMRKVLDVPLEVVADRAGWEQTVGELLEPEARRRLGLMFDFYDVHGFTGNPRVLSWLLGRQPLTFEEWVRRNRALLSGL